MMEKYCIGSLAGYSNGCNGSSPSRQTSNGTTATENGTGNSHKKDVIPNDLIDLNKPMFWQIGKLKEKYIEWVFTSSDKDLRFFESDFLEKLTMCRWPVIPIFWSPIILFFIYLSFSNFSSNGNESFLFGSVGIWQMPLLLAFGILMWTFFEYVIHRWVFHLVPPASWFLTTIHFLFHGQHHKNPMNKDRLVFPPLPAAPFAFVIYQIVHLIFPRATAQCIIAGVAIGYVFYDLTHYYLHHGSPTSRYWKELKAFHIKHHYSEPNYGFGISSKLWDYPFGTLFPDDTKIKSN